MTRFLLVLALMLPTFPWNVLAALWICFTSILIRLYPGLAGGGPANSGP